MSNYIGDFAGGVTIRKMFSTRDKDGAAITFGGTPALAVYKDASDTQTTTGVTLTVDAAAVTGQNRVVVDTANSFYATGSDFFIAVTSGTVDSESVVGSIIAHFSIENRTTKPKASYATDIQSYADAALVARHLDHLLAVDYDPASKPGVATALFNELVESDGGVSRFTQNALEQAPYSNSGTGSYPITVTVTDGTSALQGATVRVEEGNNSYTAVTGSNGQASFSLNSATYTVAVTKDGYSHTPESRTVTGSQAGTLVSSNLVMTSISIPSAPTNANLCSVYGWAEDLHGVAKPNVPVLFELKGSDSFKDAGGKMVDTTAVTVTTDASGNFPSTDFQRTDKLTPATGYYEVTSAGLGLNKVQLKLAATTKNLADIIT